MLVAGALLAGCGGGDDEQTVTDLTGEWDVLLLVGAADADAAADPSAFPGVGSDVTEVWTLDCDDGGCVLSRPPGGFLGGLDDVALEPGEAELTVRGEVGGVVPAPALEPSPCAGTAAETWTVQMELTLDGDDFVGSVFRIPDALVAGDCFGLDLTLGLSGSRRT
jgi:hypothetical protein